MREMVKCNFCDERYLEGQVHECEGTVAAEPSRPDRLVARPIQSDQHRRSPDLPVPRVPVVAQVQNVSPERLGELMLEVGATESEIRAALRYYRAGLERTRRWRAARKEKP